MYVVCVICSVAQLKSQLINDALSNHLDAHFSSWLDGSDLLKCSWTWFGSIDWISSGGGLACFFSCTLGSCWYCANGHIGYFSSALLLAKHTWLNEVIAQLGPAIIKRWRKSLSLWVAIKVAIWQPTEQYSPNNLNETTRLVCSKPGLSYNKINEKIPMKQSIRREELVDTWPL